MTKRSILAGVAFCLLVAGCGSSPERATREDAAAPVSSPPVSTVAPAVAPVGNPSEITIPAIGVHSSLIPLGLTETNEHEVPPVTQPEQAGWYEPGPEPGQTGPAIVLGHINGGGRPGVFAHLADLKPGDDVQIDTLTFRVTQVEQADKDAFPAERVYGKTDDPELRLITCGGAFDRASGNYLDNTIVYAVEVP